MSDFLHTYPFVQETVLQILNKLPTSLSNQQFFGAPRFIPTRWFSFFEVVQYFVPKEEEFFNFLPKISKDLFDDYLSIPFDKLSTELNPITQLLKYV